MIDKEIEAELEKCYIYGNLNKDKVKELIKRIAKEEYDEGWADRLKCEGLTNVKRSK